jgi:hypothetical protein
MSNYRIAWFALALAGSVASVAAQGAQWVEQFGTNAHERSYSVVHDGVGGTPACGRTSGHLFATNPAQPFNDAWVARFDGAGALLWGRQFGTSDEDAAYAVTHDGAGGVFVAGGTEGDLGGPAQASGDAWIARFDGVGDVLWTVQLGSTAWESVWCLAPDGSGGVYASGRTGGSLVGQSAGLWDVWLGRWNAAGQNLWLRQFGSSGGDYLEALARSGTGGVLLGGFSHGNLGGTGTGQGGDGWYAHFDADGNQDWLRQIASAGFDSIDAIATDGAGGVLLAGATNGTLAGEIHGNLDAWAMRVDASGAPIWSLQFGSNANDMPAGLAPDGQGGLWLAGDTSGSLFAPLNGSGNTDMWWARIDATGELELQEQFGTATGDSLTSVVALPSGFALAGETYGVLGASSAGLSDAWLARWDEPCGSTSSYCAPSTTSIAACAAKLVASGVPDLDQPADFRLSALAVPGGNLGLCLFGTNGAASTPFGTLGGQLCVQAPFFRTGPKPSGGAAGQCNGAYAFTLADLAVASPIVAPGALLHAQVWARDPANPDGFLLSDGLEIALCP